MPVKRRLGKRREGIAPDLWDFFLDRLDDAANPFARLCYEGNIPCVPTGWRKPSEIYVEHVDEIISEWIIDHPGTRPELWWRWASPRFPAGMFPDRRGDGPCRAPRMRLGGIGTCTDEAGGWAPSLDLGIPTQWMDDVDPDDPPRYESQAAFLKRLGLLLPGEERRLRPADFEPEVIEIWDELAE